MNNTSTHIANIKFFIGLHKRIVGLNCMWYRMWLNEVKKAIR